MCRPKVQKNETMRFSEELGHQKFLGFAFVYLEINWIMTCCDIGNMEIFNKNSFFSKK